MKNYLESIKSNMGSKEQQGKYEELPRTYEEQHGK